MLKSFFYWSDTHPSSYWIIALIPTLIWAGWIAYRFRKNSTRVRGERILFALLILGVLIAWRWPFLLSATELGNPDESQLVAGAITLKTDPVFWRSVDGTTSGPLNFYALLPTHWLGIPLDYFNARSVGLLLVWGGLVLTQSLLTLEYGRALASLALIPAVLFFATAIDTDFIHYSSEHLSLFLIPLGWWLLWRYRTPQSPSRPSWGWLIAGLTAGLLPWAKLQSSLFAVGLVAWAGYLLLVDLRGSPSDRLRQFGWFVLAAAIPSIAAIIALLLTGQLEHFARSYILENISFVSGVNFPVWGIVKHLAFLSHFTWQYPVYLAGPGLLAIGGGFALLFGRKPATSLWLAALFLTLVACATILLPRRAHHHYLLYLVLPLTLWTGCVLAELWRRQPGWFRWRPILGCSIVIMAQVMIGWRFKLGEPFMYGRLLADWRAPRTELSLLIRQHAIPGDSIAMWGWQPWLFVETGLPHGTRDSHTKSQLESEAQAEYFLARYLDDLSRNKPTFFVDAVGDGPRAFAYLDRRTKGHEQFPELRDYVESEYVSFHETWGLRVFIRRDRHRLTATSSDS